MKDLNSLEKKKIFVKYVPHGINGDTFKPDSVPTEFKKRILGDKQYEFVLFWMNRNIKRKQPSDVIWAYKKFVDKLPEEKRSSVCLLMHTAPVDSNGTDLHEVKKAICPKYDVVFSDSRLEQRELVHLYNLSDVTINIAGNEGFGLTTAESLMCGTPIIVNVTGGLQDQCGFTDKDGDEISDKQYIEIGTLHDADMWEEVLNHGSWVTPVWPKVHSMIGSVPTPYIIDDKVDIKEVARAIKSWYDMSTEERTNRGRQGRDWMLRDKGLNTKHMCNMLSEGIDSVIENWKPRTRHELLKIR